MCVCGDGEEEGRGRRMGWDGMVWGGMVVVRTMCNRSVFVDTTARMHLIMGTVSQ